MKNTFGNTVSMTIFGESHGPAVGAVLDGLAAGLPVDEAAIAAAMDRRRARGDGLSTARTEADAVEFLSGVYNGHTTGTAITLMVRNLNTRSSDYAKTADLLRPGHADYTAYAKYEGFQDARGGGHFSGRITAASVAAGAICETVLNSLGVKVYTHIAECAGVQDAPLSSAAGLVMPDPQPGHFALLDASKEEAMQTAIRAAGSEGDSVGGILETIVTGLPAGIGEPWFDSVESELAHLMFAIPACKGIEFGAGFGFAALRGSQANDPFTMRGDTVATATNKNGGINGGILETIVTGLPAGIGEPWFDSVESELAHLMFAIPACKGIEFGAGFGFAALRGSQANDPFTMRGDTVATATNKNGGINGGITNGMPIVFRTVLKPTPSIYKQQHTVDYIGKTDGELQIKGRHDPCIVPRAAVVQNTLTAFGLLDLLTVRYGTLAQKHGLPQE
ncbi:chorismate synthase [Gemmiger sp.]|uniref:chorismate synthase n=1 Tax=Gemmiger sp. TaxID=2049027 RepID=UPI00307E1186